MSHLVDYGQPSVINMAACTKFIAMEHINYTCMHGLKPITHAYDILYDYKALPRINCTFGAYMHVPRRSELTCDLRWLAHN